MRQDKQPQLAGRRQPLQQRAKESVDQILVTAAELLDELGVEGFNTNLLAERAGVRVRTVYRYFPNKYSVIVAVADRLSAHWGEWMREFYAALGTPGSDWRSAVRDVQREWIAHARREPGSVAVLKAISVVPELRELDERIFQEMCEKTLVALTARRLKLPQAHLLAIARALMSSVNSGVELCFRLKPSEREPFLRELESLQASYLGQYLDGPERPGRAAASRQR